MGVLFMGGEPCDFLNYGTVSWSGTDLRGAGVARGNLVVGINGNNTSFNNEWTQYFSAPAGEFWTSAYMGGGQNFNHSALLAALGLADGSKNRVLIGWDGDGTAILWTENDGSTAPVQLARSEHPNAIVWGIRLDLYVKLDPVNGRVKLYTNGVLQIDYTGPLGGSSTTLNRIRLGNASNYNGWSMGWQEIFCTTYDTRSLTLKTHYPTANGADVTWTGSYADVDEADFRAASDAITVTDVEQIASFTTNDLPTGSQTVRAVKVGGVFSRGLDSTATGVRLGLKENGVYAFSDEFDVETGLTWVSKVWETNPVTGIAFSRDDVNGMEIAVKSAGTVAAPIIPPTNAEVVSATASSDSMTPQ